MITRRKFLEGSMATLILIPLVGCSDDDPNPTGITPTGCQGPTTTGSTANAHVHTVCIPQDRLTNPPPTGTTLATSTDSGHSHLVILSQADLQSIEAGGTVDVTSQGGGGHEHNFSIVKA